MATRYNSARQVAAALYAMVEKRLQAVSMACFLQPEYLPRHSAHRGQSMEGKWAFLYLMVVVVLTLSYSVDLGIIKLPSIALPVMHLRTVAD